MVRSGAAHSKYYFHKRHKARSQFMRLPLFEPLEPRQVLSTFTVVNSDDSGLGSLRQAIDDANTHVGADVVKFNGVSGTITLASELLITDELKIAGPGAQNLEVSGGGTTRVFHIASGVPVQIKKLTISNGFVSGAPGGGILNQGTLTLQDSVVTGSKSVGSFPGGLGGGIENEGVLNAQHSTISDNYAADSGGGIRNYYYATTTLDRVTVSNNACNDLGGGIDSWGARLFVNRSLISGNKDFGLTVFNAGGISANGQVHINNSTIRDNVGQNAGLSLGGPNFSYATIPTDMVISHSLITKNTALAFSNTPDAFIYGVGGVFVDDKVRIEYTTISDNVGQFAGGVGAINYSRVDLEILQSTINGNTAAGPALTFGATKSRIAGGIMAPAKIESSTISGNTAMGSGTVDYGGGPVHWEAGYAAGGMLSFKPGYSPPASIDHTTIAFNKVLAAVAGHQATGGIAGMNLGYGYGDSDIGIRNTIIAKNSVNLGDPDVSGVFISAGHNLIGVLGSSATGFVASDLSGTATQALDPHLLPLKHNGGFTNTHALKENSPAVDAGDNADAPLTDQRGRTRIVNDIIDIGAYERQANTSSASDPSSARDNFWSNYARSSADEDEWMDALMG